MSGELLYGKPGDEYMQRDEHDLWEQWWDSGNEGEQPIEEWSTRGYDGILESPALIIERVIERAADECGFEEAYAALERAGDDSDVVAAFTAARALLVAKTSGWIFADELLRKGKMFTIEVGGKPAGVFVWEDS